MPSVRVRIDGQLADDAEARAIWRRFSEHMEASPRDLQGFAEKEGFRSARPGLEDGDPVLLLSRTGVQAPYAAVGPSRSGGGSPGGQARPHRGAPGRKNKKGSAQGTKK